MTHEHEHDRARRSSEATHAHLDPTPTRTTRSSQLDAPAHPITSGLIQRKAARDGDGVAADADQAVAAATDSSGSSLPITLMRKFEASLGTDLSGVRVHTGEASAAAATAVGAKAYTVGQDIHFGHGQYAPSSLSGEHLLAHEVAHTVQQRGGTPTRQNKLEVSASTDAFEIEADQAADAMLAGTPAQIASASGIARKIMRESSPQPSSEPVNPGGNNENSADDINRSEAEKALVTWERSGEACLDTVQQWLIENWTDYIGATSSNPHLGWADSKIEAVCSSVAGTLITTLGEEKIRAGSAAVAAALIGSAGGPLGSVVGFAIGSLVGFAAGLIVDSITGKTDPDQAAADASTRTAALIGQQCQQIADKTATSKTDLASAIDAAREQLTNATTADEVIRIRDQACAETAQLGGGNASDRSLSNKMVADWALEHASGPTNANSDTSEAQWKGATERAFGSSDLSGHLELFAYQCRGHWANAGLVDPYSEQMITDANSASQSTTETGAPSTTEIGAMKERWSNKLLAFNAARDPATLAAFLRANKMPLDPESDDDLKNGCYNLVCQIELAIDHPETEESDSYVFACTVVAWNYTLTMTERTGADAGISKWTNEFTCKP